MNKTMLGNVSIERLEQVLREWHEAGRADFEHFTPSINYDEYAPKVWVDRGPKYVALDVGGPAWHNQSGCYIMDKITGDVYRIAAYGVPKKDQRVGNIGSLKGETLHNLRGVRWTAAIGNQLNG